nr:MAG TPA: hypothetical protein [Caudoviricetes sp.]
MFLLITRYNGGLGAVSLQRYLKKNLEFINIL